MKGAINVISIVMISGIIITLVGATYLWSIPLVNKGETTTIFQTASSFALGLNKQIIEIANVGGGEGSMDIPLGAIELIPNGASDLRNNSILFKFIVTQPLALDSSKTYLGGASFLDIINTTVGTFGESSPSIISLEVSPLGTAYQATIQIYFRPLKTNTGEFRKIAFNYYSTEKSAGNNKITFAFDKNIQDGDTIVTNINVFVV